MTFAVVFKITKKARARTIDYECLISLFEMKVGLGSFIQWLYVRVNTLCHADSILCVFRWTKNHKSSSFPLVVLKERTIKVPALTRGQWHHLVISLTQPKVSTEEQKNVDVERMPSSKVRYCTISRIAHPGTFRRLFFFSSLTILINLGVP